MTDEQLEKVVRYARQFANRRVRLMFDANEQGDNGAKEALWELAQTDMEVDLVWSQSKLGGAFQGRETESVTDDEWNDIRVLLER